MSLADSASTSLLFCIQQSVFLFLLQIIAVSSKLSSTMQPTLSLLLVAVAVVTQISEARVVLKRDANGRPRYAYAVTAEEMAAGGNKRIARNADAPTEYDAVAAAEMAAAGGYERKKRNVDAPTEYDAVAAAKMAAAGGYERKKRNVDAPTEYDAVAAEEMAAAAGYERIARNADAVDSLSCCGGCCDYRCTGRACSCCYA